MRIETSSTARVGYLSSSGRTTPREAPLTVQEAVQLSPAVQTFLGARRAVTALGPVRQEQVSHFQSQVSSGQYQVDGEACAAAMIPSEEVKLSA